MVTGNVKHPLALALAVVMNRPPASIPADHVPEETLSVAV
jgi:hypothetical protein